MTGGEDSGRRSRRRTPFDIHFFAGLISISLLHFLGGIQIKIQYLTDTQPVAVARKSLFVALACYY